MNSSFDDQLRDRLRALDADLGDVRLPGPDAARVRAAQRNRNQVTGVVLAAVAVIAIAVAGVAPVFSTPDDSITARTETETPTSSEPSTTPPTAADGTNLTAALMTTSDITDGEELGWAESSEPAAREECVPNAAAVAASEQARIDFAAAGGNRLSQDLLRAESADGAVELFEEIRVLVMDCLPEQGSEETPWIYADLDILNVGDAAWMARYSVDPADLDADTVTIGLVLRTDVVSLTVRVEPTGRTGSQVDLETPVAAASRMCRVLFGDECVGEPELVDLAGGGEVQNSPSSDDPSQDSGQQNGADNGESGDDGQPDETSPPEASDPPEPELLDLADEPYLRDDDVNPVGTYSGFSRVSDYAEDESYSFRCLNDLDNAGADAVVMGHWFHDGEGSVAEFILRMPSHEQAMRIITDHTILPEQCGEVGETREQTVYGPTVIDVDGADEALTWTIDDVPLPEDPGSEPSFTGVGMARTGNVVVVISFGAFADPTDGGWDSYAARTLALALQRATR